MILEPYLVTCPDEPGGVWKRREGGKRRVGKAMSGLSVIFSLRVTWPLRQVRMRAGGAVQITLR